MALEKLQQEILDLIVDQRELTGEPMTGGAARAVIFPPVCSPEDRELFDRALASLSPRHLVSELQTPDGPAFGPTLDGWLDSKSAEKARTVVMAFIKVFRGNAMARLGDFTRVTWDEVCQAGGLDSRNDYNACVSVAYKADLTSGGLHSAYDMAKSIESIPSATFNRPPGAIEMVELQSFDEFLEYRRKRRRRNLLERSAWGRSITPSHRRAINLVYQHLFKTGTWPRTKQLEIDLMSYGIEPLTSVIDAHGFLKGSEVHGPQPRESTLTLEGLVFAEGSEEDQAALVDVVTFLADVYFKAADDVRVGALALADKLKVDEQRMHRVGMLMMAAGSPFYVTGGPELPSMEFQAQRDYLPMRNTKSLEEILDIVHRPVHPEDPFTTAVGQQAPAVVTRDRKSKPTGLDRWKQLKGLKGGGQGVVTKVQDRTSGAIGVLKRMKVEEDKKAAQYFRREIMNTKKLEHPHIVEVLDVSAKGEHPRWYVTRFARLGSLWKNLHLFRGDTWGTLRAARGLASALRAAHDAKVIHRDVKPQNILVLAQDCLVLTDFGIAFDQERYGLTTQGGEHPVVAWYGPDEAQEPGYVPVPNLDVFSIGRVIYSMLAGDGLLRFRHPQSHLDDEFNLVSRFGRPDLVPINDLISKLAAHDPTKRFQTMQEVVEAIDRTTSRLGGRQVLDPSACRGCETGKYIDAHLLQKAGIDVRTLGYEENALVELAAQVCENCGDVRLSLPSMSTFRRKPRPSGQ